MTCTHTRHTSRWVEEEDWYHGGTTGEWQYDSESTTVDLDLHRYQCTQCNEIFYYSGRAKDYYENGVESPWIKGLGQ